MDGSTLHDKNPFQEFKLNVTPTQKSLEIQLPPKQRQETKCRVRTRYLLWKVITFFITLVVLLIGFPGNPGKVWTIALINFGVTTALYFVYRYALTKVKWGYE